MTPAFIHLATHFKLLKLRVYVQFSQPTTLPAYKGGMLHGWLGHTLQKIDNRAYSALFIQHDNQQPKPYCITPSADQKTNWQQGELYSFDISLFGDAVSLTSVLVDAITWGQKLGFGSSRAPFKLVSLSSMLPGREVPGIQIANLLDYMPDFKRLSHQVSTPCEIAVHCETPLRLKMQGRVMKHQPPNMNELINIILRRWAQLSRYWVDDTPELFDALYESQLGFRGYEVNSHCYYEDWKRFSIREQSEQPFGGLKGQFSYYGELFPALPWLHIGEQLQIGAKTTFGLGCYRVIATEPNN